MKLVVSHNHFTTGLQPVVSRRRIFRNRAAAMRQAEKWARKSLRKFAPASRLIVTDNWGYRAGAFPADYTRTVVQMAVAY